MYLDEKPSPKGDGEGVVREVKNREMVWGPQGKWPSLTVKAQSFMR